jgi:hypothetical protein
MNNSNSPKNMSSTRIFGLHFIGDSLGSDMFCKMESPRNYPHQNVLVTWTQVKTLHRQQTSCTASTSNIEILEKFQSKASQMIVDIPALNTVLASVHTLMT